PRPRAARWLTGTDIHGAVLGGATGAGRLIAHHLSVFSEVASGPTEAEGEAAIQAALLIVDRALGGEALASAAQVEAIRRTVRETAIGFIDRNLVAPDLSVAAIAR